MFQFVEDLKMFYLGCGFVNFSAIPDIDAEVEAVRRHCLADLCAHYYSERLVAQPWSWYGDKPQEFYDLLCRILFKIYVSYEESPRGLVLMDSEATYEYPQELHPSEGPISFASEFISQLHYKWGF